METTVGSLFPAAAGASSCKQLAVTLWHFNAEQDTHEHVSARQKHNT